VTVPEKMDAIHSRMLDDQKVSTRKIVQTLIISKETVGFM
jgi:hypothetical protein